LIGQRQPTREQGSIVLTVLVLGANGFIGKRVVRALLERQQPVRMLTRKPAGAAVEGLEVITGDLTDPQLPLEPLLAGCNIIINCAGEVTHEALMPALHVAAVERLLAAIAGQACPNPLRWVQLSSVGAYGPAKGVRTVTEETAVNPQGVYEQTKTQADLLLMKHPALAGPAADWTILRPSNVFARDMPNGSIRQLAAAIRRGMFFYVGYKTPVATYVHADDVAQALLKCAFDDRASRQIFNLSNDCPLHQVIDALARCQGVASPRMKVPESLVRLAVALGGRLVKLPLTQARVDALVSQTRYPADKLQRYLDFVPAHGVPTQIQEVLK